MTSKEIIDKGENMTIEEAIAKLNVLSSYDTTAEKREEYKQCINAILENTNNMNQFIKAFSEDAVTHYIVNDIIDFYRGKYKDYEEYCKVKNEINVAIQSFNKTFMGDFKYCLEQTTLPINYFNCAIKRREQEKNKDNWLH